MTDRSVKIEKHITGMNVERWRNTGPVFGSVLLSQLKQVPEGKGWQVVASFKNL